MQFELSEDTLISGLSESALTPEQRSAKYLKKVLADHLYYKLGSIIVIDEFKHLDIFAIKKSGYSIEFEIKVSKADFDREIKIINTQEQMWDKDANKWYKHAQYLKKIKKDTNYLIPNDFCFYVPDYLAKYALKQLVNLPYGLFLIGKTHKDKYRDICYSNYSGWKYTLVKKPKKLHSEKIDLPLYKELGHALTVRNILYKEEMEDCRMQVFLFTDGILMVYIYANTKERAITFFETYMKDLLGEVFFDKYKEKIQKQHFNWIQEPFSIDLDSPIKQNETEYKTFRQEIEENNIQNTQILEYNVNSKENRRNISFREWLVLYDNPSIKEIGDEIGLCDTPPYSLCLTENLSPEDKQLIDKKAEEMLEKLKVRFSK